MPGRHGIGAGSATTEPGAHSFVGGDGWMVTDRRDSLLLQLQTVLGKEMRTIK